MPTPERPFGRVLTAMVTPFTSDGGVDLEAAGRLADHLCRHGHDGLVVLGTTGESPTVTDAETSGLVRAVKEAVGDRAQVVVGVGTFDTRHAVENARRAAAAGADGLLVVTPYYSKPPQEGIQAHNATVADATDLPVMLYDIPGRTGVKLSYETLQRAAEHPRILALKEAAGDLLGTTRLMHETDLAVYSGEDALNFTWLALGAAGVVSVVGHVAGERWCAMSEAIDAGDLVTARRINVELVPVVDAIMNRQGGAIRAKAAMEVLGVLDNRAMRAPLVEASDDDVAELRQVLGAAGLLA